MKRKSDKIADFEGNSSSDKIKLNNQDAASTSSIAKLFKRIESRRKFAL